MSTAKPPPGAVVPSCGDMKRSVRLVKSGERMRAMRVGVRNRVHATWHATMFTSSLLVSATSMSAPAAPACSSVRGLAALPRTVRMSSRSCRSRSTSSSISTTVTSLASSRARWYAAVRPTWPAPRMMIFTVGDLRAGAALFSRIVVRSYGFEVGVAHHEPLRPLAFEIHLHPCVRALSLDREHHAVAELLVTHPLAEPQAARLVVHEPARARGDVHGPRHLHPGPDFLDELGRYLGDEPRRRTITVHAVHATLLGVGEVQIAHGPGGADITEPTLLLETDDVGDRARVREEPVLQAAQEDHRELETLGRMQGHHLHAVLPGLGLPFAGFEHRVREKRRERRHARILGLEAPRGADELLQVLEPRLALVRLLLAVVRGEPAGCDDMIHLLMQRQPARRGVELLDERNEDLQARAGARSELLPAGTARLPQRRRVGARICTQDLEGPCADPARGQIHHALERCVVVAIADQAQVGQRILDLGALEEPQAPVDAIGNAAGEQVLLEHPRLRIRAVQDRGVRALSAARDPLADAADDELGFVALVIRAVERSEEHTSELQSQSK